MRRSDREICDIGKIIQVMEKCDVCRLAFNDEEYPYIIPLNFGMKVEDGRIYLYFHGAAAGKKYELIERDNRVCFEMDCSHNLVTDETNGNCTMEYESVIGRGRIEVLPAEDKYEALYLIMKHYHKETFEFNKAVIPKTTVLRLAVESITGKARSKKKV